MFWASALAMSASSATTAITRAQIFRSREAATSRKFDDTPIRRFRAKGR